MGIWLVIKSHIQRRVPAGLAIVLLFGALAGFYGLFCHMIERKELEIEDAYDTIPVTVVLSNVQGTQTDRLDIYEHHIRWFTSEEYAYHGELQAVAFSSYVKDVLIKSTLYYGVGSEGAEAFATDLPGTQRLVGLTAPEADRELASASEPAIRFFAGYDESLFAGEETVCIVPESMLDRLEPDKDGILRITLSVQDAPKSEKATGVALTVAGCYAFDGEAIYCPWRIAADLQTRLGSPCKADSLSATVRDNRKLDEFRELLARHYAEVIPSGRQAEVAGSPVLRYFELAATVHDELLRETINKLNQSLRTLRRLLPLVYGLLLLGNGAACFFSVNLQRKELAVARSMGTRRGEVLLAVFLETLVYLAFGVGLAVLVLRAGSAVIPVSGLSGLGLAAMTGALLAATMASGRKGMRCIREVE